MISKFPNTAHAQRNAEPLQILAGTGACFLFFLLGFFAASRTMHCEKEAGTVFGTSHLQQANTRWSYDEMAHKLVMEPARHLLDERDGTFSSRIGSALSHISSQLRDNHIVIQM